MAEGVGTDRQTQLGVSKTTGLRGYMALYTKKGAEVSAGERFRIIRHRWTLPVLRWREDHSCHLVSPSQRWINISTKNLPVVARLTWLTQLRETALRGPRRVLLWLEQRTREADKGTSRRDASNPSLNKY